MGKDAYSILNKVKSIRSLIFPSLDDVIFLKRPPEFYDFYNGKKALKMEQTDLNVSRVKDIDQRRRKTDYCIRRAIGKGAPI